MDARASATRRSHEFAIATKKRPNAFKGWRDVLGGKVIEFPYLVMFRNENDHFVSVGGGSEFKTEKEATAKAKVKCDELKTTVYVMEAVELYEPKSNK
jgi:hypothetical protein